ncbi:MAG: AAA family ATPase, partial [Chloroflexi bacterium]|nr:AAA family ATPase [Chloroflexota bacterium]
MKLKALELHGYKSFANRTDFAFHDGVTAIVGPNGSGKSNVADAIQWALGEQSYSSLRAKKTEDMIFAGSSMRLRMGMGEVSLTLDNSEGWLPIEFSEVTVTRRAYRSGENEYLLNGNRVRLRDINELLAKGGLGRGSYSVIGQGLIDQAISLRPEERRSLLEDAAGISIYQTKKADALSKLNATHENLTRVSDILHELEPRVKRLREQANRASQFNEVQRKLAERLQTWYGYQWQQAQEKLAEAEANVQRTERALTAAREGLQSSDTERQRLRDSIQQQRIQLSALQTQANEQQRAEQQLSQRLAVAQERVSLLSQQHHDAQRELDALLTERDAAAQQRAQVTAELSEIEAESQAVGERLRELRASTAQREQRMHAQRQLRAEAQQSAMALAQQIAQHTQRIASAEQRLQAIAEEKAEHQHAADAHAQELQVLDQRIALVSMHLGELRVRSQQHATALSAAQAQVRETQARVSHLGAHLAEAQAQARAAEIELESVRGRGAQQALADARELGIHSAQPLHNLYHVSPEHDALVRGALGLHADALVVPSWSEAQQLAAQLRTRQAIFVLESFGDALPSPLAPRPDGESYESELSSTCSALDFIACAPEHRALFQSLLAPVHIGDGALPRVSERGELLTAHGIVTPDQSAPNLAALEQRAQEWQQQVNVLPTASEQARADEAAAIQQRETLSAERYAIETERAQAQSELDALSRERDSRQRDA